ncbi:MAG: NAD(P)/FAD-dependent oxidoreductase [Propionicimonas sp.]
MDAFDVVIIGGGAAGLSAALVLARSRPRVLVLDAGTPRNGPAAHMHGFLSRDGMPPGDLLATGRAEIAAYGGTFVSGLATGLFRVAGGFEVDLEGGGRVSARRVLVASGLRDELPEIPGLQDRWALDVLHCPYCHGWEVRDQQLGVIWNGPDTVRFAQIVRQWTEDIILFVPAGTLADGQRSQLAARGIGVVEGIVGHVVVEDDHLRGVELADGRTIGRDALFVPPHLVPNNRLPRQLGCHLDEQGWVTTGPFGATTEPGVWAAGNIANPRAQVITAAGEGSAAAIAINADLVDEEVRNAVADQETRT